MKGILFSLVLLLIGSNTAFSQCEKYIFSMDEEIDFNSQTILEDLCAANTGLKWKVVDSIDRARYTKKYKLFKEMVQYQTHFSNILENTANRDFAYVSLTDEKTGKILTSSILSIEFYYEYQCDSLISTFNKYHLTSFSTPKSYYGQIIVLKTGWAILVFFDEVGLKKEELEKIYLVCKKALEED